VANQDPRRSILFVCLGNICRSPLAEGIFLHHLNRRNAAHRFRVDSAGTGGWHAGERPDHRALEVAMRRGVQLPSLARQVTRADLRLFDHLVCMDRSNRRHLQELGASEEKLSLMLQHHPARSGDGGLGGSSELDVPDPYYGGLDDFERVFDLLDAACAVLADRLGA